MAAFAADFYIDADTARAAVLAERMFNLMHLESGVKVDFIVRKSTEFRQERGTTGGGPDRPRQIRFGDSRLEISFRTHSDGGACTYRPSDVSHCSIGLCKLHGAGLVTLAAQLAIL